MILKIMKQIIGIHEAAVVILGSDSHVYELFLIQVAHIHYKSKTVV